MSTAETQLIFDRPEIQAKRHRVVYSVLTLAAWVVWMYLWLPLITLVAWYFGLTTFVREIAIPEPATMVATGVLYLLVVIIMGVVLVTWSRYNLQRFGGEDRRKGIRYPQDAEIRTRFGLSTEDLARFRKGGSLTIEHGDDGEVLAVTERGTIDPPASASAGAASSLPR